MGISQPGPSCRWVRARLPLLDDGELAGGERRAVERHLIACPACRSRRQSLASTLGILHAAVDDSALAASTADAPSLWPALQRQIVETRHAPCASAPSFASALADLWDGDARLLVGRLARALHAPLRPAPSLLFAGAIGAVLCALAIGIQAHWREIDAQAEIAESAQPGPMSLDDVFLYAAFPDVSPLPSEPPPLSVAIPSNVIIPGLAQADSMVSTLGADLPAPRGDADGHFDYDLDHGTPMNPDVVDSKASY